MYPAVHATHVDYVQLNLYDSFPIKIRKHNRILIKKMIQSQTLNDADIFTIMMNGENIKSF